MRCYTPRQYTGTVCRSSAGHNDARLRRVRASCARVARARPPARPRVRMRMRV